MGFFEDLKFKASMLKMDLETKAFLVKMDLDYKAESIGNAIKEGHEILKEGHEILSDGRKELKEIMTDGIKEMVIEGNTDYKTSFEMKEEAEKIVNSADNLRLDSHKKIRDKLSSLNKHLKSNYDLKRDILSLFGYNDHRCDNIEFKNNYVYNPEWGDRLTDEEKFLKFFGLEYSLLAQMFRRDKAKEFLEDAKDYELKVKKEATEIERYIGHINEIDNLLTQEELLLNKIKQSVNTYHDDKNRQQVVDLLNRLLVQFIISDDGSPSAEYRSILDKLKSLESFISKPTE